MPPDFIDANVLLRHLTDDHEEHSPRATRFLEAVERGDRSVYFSELVFSEVVWTLNGLYKRSKTEIRDTLVQILGLRGIVVDDRDRLVQTLDLYARLNVSLVDAYLAASVASRDAGGIVSFDRDFDRVPGITRIEP